MKMNDTRVIKYYMEGNRTEHLIISLMLRDKIYIVEEVFRFIFVGVIETGDD